MLTLIHGDDLLSGRKALIELKTKYSESEQIVFDGTQVSLTDIVSTVDSLSLFSQEKLITVENLLSGTMSRQKEEILDFIRKEKIAVAIILYEQKEIGKALIKKYFSAAKIIYCPLPQLVFKFLDNLGKNEIAEVISLFHQIIKDRDSEFILSMLVRQWRNLIIAKDLGTVGFAGMPSWQAYKFINQAKFFSLDKLLSSYRQLLAIDLKVKSGLTSFGVNQLLDIFFISLYYQN